MTSQTNLADAVGSWQRGEYDGARRTCLELLRFAPENVEALNLFAMASAHLGDANAAIDALERAIALRPEDLALHNNLGGALLAAGRSEEALAAFRQVVTQLPGHADGYFNLGNALQKAGRWSDAIVEYGKTIAIDPKHARAHYQTGNALRQRGDSADAVAAYDNALQLAPELAEALQNQAGCLLETLQFSAAATVSRRLIRLRPDSAEAHFTLGAALQGLGVLDEALQNFTRAWQLQPSDPRFLARLWRGRRHMACSLDDHAQREHLRTLIEATGYAQSEWIPDIAADAAEANRYAKMARRAPAGPEFTSPHRAVPINQKIKVALIGADLPGEATAAFLNGWLRARTSAEFEVVAIELSRHSRAGDAAAIRPLVDQWVAAGMQSDVDIARWLRDSDVDIAVDLMGQGAGSRGSLMALRPARIQVQYLGFGGTSAAAGIDYLIADDILVPERDTPHYVERIVRLPAAYDAASVIPVADINAARSRFKLSAHRRLYCHGGPVVAIDDETWECWIRVLKSVPDSALCLPEENRWAVMNLKKRVEQRGIAAERIVFSRLATAEERLLWLSAMNLYLTAPHETAAHVVAAALRLGVPCVATLGATFWARQAASLLHAYGQSERIAKDAAEYERLACGSVSACRSGQRDASQFPEYFEAALRAIHETDARGAAPRDIRVGPHSIRR